MEIIPEHAQRAMEEALARFPRYAAFAPRLVARPVYQGYTLAVEYAEHPPPGDPDAWEFQNAVVKTYRRLAAV